MYRHYFNKENNVIAISQEILTENPYEVAGTSKSIWFFCSNRLLTYENINVNEELINVFNSENSQTKFRPVIKSFCLYSE